MDVLQAVEVRIGGGADDLAHDSPVARVRHEQIERQTIALGQEHQRRAVGTERRADLDARGARHHACAGGRLRFRGRFDRGVPLARQLLRIDPRRLFHASNHTAPFRTQHGRNYLVAEACAQVRPQRMTEAVREIARVVELLERRQSLVQRRIPHPHRGVRVLRSQ
jgi:hypothetical protein